METKLKHLQEILYYKGRTIARQRVITITPVHVLKNESFQVGQGCFSDILGSQDCACFSLFCTHRKNSLESKSESMTNAHNIPVLPGQPYFRGPLKIYLKRNHFFQCSQIYGNILQEGFNPLVVQNSLRLVIWAISGKTYLQEGCKKGLPILSQTIGVTI